MRFLESVRGWLILLPLIASITAFAEDWPQWRGPRRDGISSETGLLEQWPTGGPKLVGKITGLGMGFSSIALVNGKIFTMGALAEDEMVMAFDLVTGNKLWAAKVGKLFKEPHGDGPRSTPAVDGGLVYALGSEGNLVCIDSATGKEVWRKSLPVDFKGKTSFSYGFSESPLVDGDRVICTPGAKDALVVALDKKTGNLIWKAPMPSPPEGVRGAQGASFASLISTTHGGLPQYIAFTGLGLVGIAAQDGHILWNTWELANSAANCMTPIVHDDQVFASAGGHGSSCVQFIQTGSSSMSAKEKYHLDNNTFVNQHGGVVMIGDYLYGGHRPMSGWPVCIELKTGRVDWKENKAPGNGSAAVTAAEGRLYFSYEDGTVALIEANPTAYKLISQFQQKDLTGPAWAYPVICSGRLFLRNNDTLSIYDLRK